MPKFLDEIKYHDTSGTLHNLSNELALRPSYSSIPGVLTGNQYLYWAVNPSQLRYQSLSGVAVHHVTFYNPRSDYPPMFKAFIEIITPYTGGPNLTAWTYSSFYNYLTSHKISAGAFHASGKLIYNGKIEFISGITFKNDKPCFEYFPVEGVGIASYTWEFPKTLPAGYQFQDNRVTIMST